MAHGCLSLCGLRCNAYNASGLPVAASCRQGRSGRLAVVAATSAPMFRRADPPVPDNHVERDYNEDGAAQYQYYPSSVMTRTSASQVSASRPFVLGAPPGSLGGSHTQPANSGLAAYGCYRLFGPARISKRGDCLVARLLPGARLELLSGGAGTTGGVGVGTATTVAETDGGGATAAVRRTRTLTLAEAAAGLSAEADGWDVRCACGGLSSVDGDGGSEEVDGDTSGGGTSDDDALTECVLVAAYVELGGSASSVDMVDNALQPAVHHHNGHTYLSVRNMPPSAVITLSADGDLSHPVNVTPPAPAPTLSAVEATVAALAARLTEAAAAALAARS